MAKKEFTFRGKTLEELKKLSLNEFMELVPSRQRRKFKRGFTDREKKFLKKIESGKNNVETHAREMVILPVMVGKTIKIHQGKEFFPVLIQEEMVGHVLGEFALTRRKVGHSSPGVGSTKSSGSVSMK